MDFIKDIQKDWIEFRDLCKELTSNEIPDKNSFIHPFSIFRSLEECADDNAIFVSDGGGTTVYSSFQSIYLREQAEKTNDNPITVR